LLTESKTLGLEKNVLAICLSNKVCFFVDENFPLNDELVNVFGSVKTLL